MKRNIHIYTRGERVRTPAPSIFKRSDRDAQNFNTNVKSESKFQRDQSESLKTNFCLQSFISLKKFKIAVETYMKFHICELSNTRASERDGDHKPSERRKNFSPPSISLKSLSSTRCATSHLTFAHTHSFFKIWRTNKNIAV